jgi:hypothetical protein
MPSRPSCIVTSHNNRAIALRPGSQGQWRKTDSVGFQDFPRTSVTTYASAFRRMKHAKPTNWNNGRRVHRIATKYAGRLCPEGLPQWGCYCTVLAENHTMQAWANRHYAASCSVTYVARQILHLMPLVSLVTEGREFPTSDSPRRVVLGLSHAVLKE